MDSIKVGRKTVLFSHKNFEYFQPNDHSCGDCALRATAKALGKTWYQTFDALVPIARRMQRMPNDTEVVGELLKENGFVWRPIKVERGDTRPTVAEFAADHTEKCVLRVASHLVACGEGKYYDIWDCGGRSLYGYWIKKK